jgi:HEAT repeat protein
MKRALGWMVVASLAGAPLVAVAAPTGAATAGASLEALKRDVNGEDDGAAIEAAQKLGALGATNAKAVDVLLDALALGATPRVQAAILSALAGRKDPRAVEVLQHYAKNRNVDVRKKAIAALAELPGERAVPTLVAALSDPAEEVRAVAAGALAKRKDKSATEKLVKLLERKDAAAAAALGAVGTPDLAHRLAEMLGQVPDGLLATALGEMIKRPDFGPDAVKLDVVKTLAKIPGVDSTTALIEYVARTEKDKALPSRVEAQKIVDQRSANQ